MKKLIIFTIFYFIPLAIFCQIIYNDSIIALEKDIITTPRIRQGVDSYKLYSSNYFDSITQPCDNFIAQKYFISRLNAIKIGFIFWENIELATKEDMQLITENMMNVFFDGVRNFIPLTNIESESESDFFGTYQPTHNDIRLWEEWYNLNKEFLCWDEKTGLIYCISRK